MNQEHPDRRGFTKKIILGTAGMALAPGVRIAMPQTAASGHAEPLTFRKPANPLVPWMYMIFPIEQWLADYERTFDAWADGGVRGVVIGPLHFYHEVPRFDYTYQRPGARFPTFAPDPGIYRSYGVDPPPAAHRDPEKEKLLRGLLDNAVSRGWEILTFGPGIYGGSKPFQQDPFGAVGLAAGIADTMRAFPQLSGVIIDGAGEHPYELAFHHGGELFEIRDQEKQQAKVLGIDAERMERGMESLRRRFHQLTPALVRYHTPGGFLGGMSLFAMTEDALYWLRSRQEMTLRGMADIRRQIDGMNRKVKLGTIPRSPAFSILTTQDYQRMHVYFDYIFPKHYFWHRGFDGMYGTIARWVRTIGEWNPGLTEQDCFNVVKSWFGLTLPGVASVADMELGFPDEFFSQVVYSETRRALEAVGDPAKVIAWVSTGRNPHAGDPMPARDLYRILAESHRAGLKRFIYHPDLNLTASEWSVISGLCGNRWKEDPNGYWPPETPKPDTWNGGRKPGRPRE